MRVVAVVALLLAACGGEAAGDDGRLVVVTTVAPITSIAANVIGDLAEIRGVVPEGTNSHTYEPPPSVAEVMTDANLVVLNGLQLEEPTLELAEENVGDGTPIVLLGDETIDPDDYAYDVSFPESGGKPNPHLWTNPPMVVRYAELIRDAMVELDPGNAEAYEANAAAFADLVGELDAAMRESFATLPEERRKLLTYHDAYAYFAEEYGWEVIGAIQVSSFEDPTPREVARLIDQVREAGVPAIFGSEVFPSPVLERIGEEAGVRYVDVLRDDDLPGDPGDPEHSWFGLMRFDFVTMVEALGGDASALEALEVRDVVPDEATYAS